MRTVGIEALGLGVRLHLSRPIESMAADLKDAWAMCPLTVEPTVGLYLHLGHNQTRALPKGCTEQVSADTAVALPQQVTQAVTRAALKANLGKLLLLHAAGIANPATGDAVALVAASGTGKTTATLTLAPQWSYLTDETVAVRPEDDSIVAYPKPLSVKRSGVLYKTETPPDSLGLKVSPVPAHLRAIVILDRQPGHAGDPAVTDIGVLDMICDIAPQSSSLHMLPEPLQMLHALHSRMRRVVRVTYAEAQSLQPLIASLLDPSS